MPSRSPSWAALPATPEINWIARNYINDCNRASIENEKKVYQRLGKIDGIAECIEISERGILLQRHKRGDLELFIEREAEIGRNLKAAWISTLIKTVLHLHNSRVLNSDIALRNVLVSDTLSVKMIDFGECILFDMDTDIDTANDHGQTAEADLFHLGCLIYSVATWNIFHHDLFEHNWTRPFLSDLPSTNGICWGETIRKSWVGDYATMQQLHNDNRESLERESQSIASAEADTEKCVGRSPTA